MTTEQIILTVCIIFVAAVLVSIVIYLCKQIPTKEEKDAAIDEYFKNDGEVLETRAEVVDMKCGTGMSGSARSPKSHEWYAVVFKDDLGKTIEVSVSHELYDEFELGMHGDLKLVDGNIYSFEAKE